LPANIRLDWKQLKAANALDCYHMKLIATVKSFTEEVPELKNQKGAQTKGDNWPNDT